MKAIKDEFPNPVLAFGRDDYIESCSFNTNFVESEIEIDAENICIPISYTLHCTGLQQRISVGDARVVVIVQSSVASYSQLFSFPCDKTMMIIDVPKFSVVNRIDVTGMIIAAHSINNFCCPGEFNDLYFASTAFEIRKGDILATEDTRSIYVDASELEKPIASIFDICRSNEQDSDVIPNFEDDKIQICLRSELYDLYYKFKDFNNGTLCRYVTGIIVYPVLTEAVGYVVGSCQNNANDTEAEYNGKRWFRSIEHKLIAKGINLQNYEGYNTTLANDLLGNVALDALKSFRNTLDSEMNNGESMMLGGYD